MSKATPQHVEQGVRQTEVVERIPDRLILDNPDQPRTIIVQSEIDELAASIAVHDIQIPLIVTPGPITSTGEQGYYLVMGQKRRLAGRQAGLYDFPCIIREYERGKASILSLVENIQRSDMHPINEAQAIKRHLTGYDDVKPVSINDLATQLGKGYGVGWINNRLALLDLKPDLVPFMEKYPKRMSHWLLIDDAKRLRPELIQFVLDGGTHAAVREFLRYASLPTATANVLQDLIDLLQRTGSIEALEQKIDQVIKVYDDAQAASSAPDKQTGSRSRRNKRTGGGNVSRGLEVTGVAEKDAKAELTTALNEAQRQLMSARAWRGQVPHLPLPKILELRQLLDDIEQGRGS